MAVESIIKTLGSGSGIDTAALVTSLVEAQFAAKNADLTKRETKLTAQLSGVATLRSAITGLDAALKSLVTGGTLASSLTSSNTAAIAVSRTPGATSADLSAAVTVGSLASRQVSTTDTGTAPGAAFRTGTLSIRLGADTVDAAGATTGFAPGGPAIDIEITDADATLGSIAAKINAAGAGVTARIVLDGGAERLSISGPSGADQAFEIAATDTGGAGESLARLAVGAGATGTSSASRARDAVVTVDGIGYRRATNTVTDLIPGATLNLVGLSATPVAIGTSKPTGAITSAVSDFVSAYNEMLAIVKEQGDAQTGPLASDGAVRALARGLSRLTTVPLAPAGATDAPRTLADLGVATARDGTLSVDTARLAKAVKDFPAAVERMFANGTGASEGGLSAALSAVVRQATDRTSGLDGSTATYARIRTTLTDAKLKVTEQTAAVRERMTRQFATMDARTAAYKATQTFLDNQIKAWNRSDA